MKPPLVSLLVVLSLACAGALHAEEAPPVFGEVVEVKVVNVDVVVTDSDGRSVHGLEREDFRLLEDGEPVELTNFLAVAGEEPGLEPAVPAPAGVEAQPAPAAPEEPVTLVLYFDNSSLIPAHRNRVLEDLGAFVEEAAASGRVRFMVVAFNPGLELIAPITGDGAVVTAALERVAAMPAMGLLAERDRRTARDQVQAIYREVQSSKGWGPAQGGAGEGGKRGKPGTNASGNRGRFFDPCVEAWGPMLNAIDGFAQQQVNRVATAQAGLTGLTRSLIGVPGRKFVLYMSDGLAQIPGMLEYMILGQLCPEREHELFSYYSRFDQTGPMEELTATANLHRVTFYALDTAGIAGLSSASAEAEDRLFIA